MNNETVVLYEYFIKDGHFTKVQHDAEVQRNGKSYAFKKKGKKGGNRRFVQKEDLGIPKSYRVCSLEDDEEKYRQILIDYCEKKIEALKMQLERECASLQALKG